VRRRGGTKRMRCAMRRSAASSSGVHTANDLLRKIVGVVVLSALGGGDLEHRIRLGGRSDRGPQRLGHSVALVEEEAAEHPVVGRDLIAPRDQRRAPGPVEVDEIGRIERRDRLGEREHIPRSDCDAVGAQLVAERDEEIDERRFSHQR
jgi:hypothetical protein